VTTGDTAKAVPNGDDGTFGIGHPVQLMPVILSAQAAGALKTLALGLVEEHDLGAPAGRDGGAEFKEICERFDADAPLLHARAGVGRETDRHAGAP
jgi:hypothetical protein